MTEKNIAEIDLSALRHNFSYLRGRIWAVSPQTEPMCVVKADAYGHSAELCVPALYGAGARHFAVSSIEEAEAVYAILARAGGCAETILILGYTPPEPENIAALGRHGITQAVFSLEYARALDAAAAAQNLRVACHIKLDSGMNRLGFDTHNGCLPATVRALRETAALENLQIDGVFSHFACADEPASPITDLQTERYIRALRACEAAGLRFSKKHICNSAGALRLPGLYQDFVRLGIVLYGLSPSNEVTDPNLIPVMRLKSRIAQIHTVHAGDFVSYGAEFRAATETTVATIPIGYADGFIRAYKSGTVMIGGRAAPLVGRICMDQCMADVTGLHAAVGDEVSIFDAAGEDIERLCRAAGTINYEAVCLVSRRVRRVPTGG